LSNEEHNREPDPREPDENIGEDAEPVEEAQGTPADPAIVEEAEVVDASDPEEDITAGYTLEDEPGEAGEDLDPLTAELEQTRRERDEYLESLRRLKAEFENSRKRQEKELTRIRERASENLVAGLLPVLDNLDRALDSEGDIRGGVKATREQLSEVLEREGLAVVASDGQPFDPTVHEAVMGQPSEEHEEGTILQTFERGYVLNGKSIRPAKVVVAREV
jgi:molecular chaperone GrpE